MIIDYWMRIVIVRLVSFDCTEEKPMLLESPSKIFGDDATVSFILMDDIVLRLTLRDFVGSFVCYFEMISRWIVMYKNVCTI